MIFPHMCNQIATRIIHLIEAAIFLSTNNLQNQYSKAINIRLGRELAMRHIFWRHITTANIQIILLMS